MPIVYVDHAVRDYDEWKRMFDSDPVGRRASGVRSHRVLRATEDPNHVLIELEFETTDEAETFRAKLEELWATAGPRLGLESPTVRVVDVVEREDY
jgi:hypothetical protein